jgi:hypothetical protein
VEYFDFFKKRKRIHFKTEKEAEKFLTAIEADTGQNKDYFLFKEGIIAPLLSCRDCRKEETK